MKALFFLIYIKELKVGIRGVEIATRVGHICTHGGSLFKNAKDGFQEFTSLNGLIRTRIYN